MLIRWAIVLASATAVCAASPGSFLLAWWSHERHGDVERPSYREFHVYDDMLKALRDMQDVYFQRWIGTWPKAIDWTAAVMGTHVAAALRTISADFERAGRYSKFFASSVGNEDPVSGYFADVIAFYFGQDAFAVRNQAYDDMLWVVLGWLEAIQFIDDHSTLVETREARTFGDESWYGNRWIPAFAHRARIFWELAAKGWDTKLCGGGMIWNPRLTPYKNAITNQLFISASIGMYLHFPGDPNTSPFGAGSSDPNTTGPSHRSLKTEWRAHDPIFCRAARAAHEWLASSNMTNSAGLYADGFHISGYKPGDSNNTKCDARDEMVYTYNQGVILSGLLGLFRTTGREAYLGEGHALVRSVIRATGWDLDRNSPVDDLGRLRPGQLPPWRGLGRAGVLEEACDVSGRCSQDGQTFKGIWMHHFAAFCGAGALRSPRLPTGAPDEERMAGIRAWHADGCRSYLGWLRHNAEAAMGTRDGSGLFGMWWTVGLLRGVTVGEVGSVEEERSPPSGDGIGEVVDYRNFGVPQDEVWVGRDGPAVEQLKKKPVVMNQDGSQRPLVGSVSGTGAAAKRDPKALDEDGSNTRNADNRDPNCRGRGRTVETQGGGLAVLRALWEVSKHEL
ncbi:Mannan endo-1,6-alpha-mannosidase DCW1 [Madurella fahalii]|uniref:Mannan endo-1,6-alpha-mannosidase DCW1 n=1 Tax=Madurella fahalii TaxID=1157608 RepID=A0ABQ0FWX4_9PEZI